VKRFATLLTGLILIVAASCSPLIEQSSDQQQKTPFFRPPGPPTVPAATPLPQNAGQPVESNIDPRPDADCQDNLTFLNDLTIQDGTVVTSLATMDKRWEVENSGTCNWNAGYRIRLIAGPEMGAQKEQALYPARSGTRATIRLLFQAPTEVGSFRSAWQAFNAQGEAFGDPFFIDITVSEAQ